VIAIFFAILAAVGNAFGTVLQRRAAATAPLELAMRIGLLVDLVRRPIWLLGGVSLLAGFIFQGLALSRAGLTLVQPIVVVELPITLIVAALLFRSRMDRDAILGAIAMSAGLAVLLISISPTNHSGTQRGTQAWLWTCVASVGLGALLVTLALRFSGAKRAALLGAASGLGFGFTAALMNGVLQSFNKDGIGGLFGAWQLYFMPVIGGLAFFLVQNAQQSGSLVASQPPVTTCDPLSSVAYGVLLFEEQLRGGLWLLPGLVGAAVIVGGSILLSRSPLAAGESATQRDISRDSDHQRTGPLPPAAEQPG
jgi:drug/metabolite transporter (DMT)-like permease